MRELRQAMAHFATGVGVVSTRTRDGEIAATTVNSLTSVSLDPPLLLVCLARESKTLDHLKTGMEFTVSLLGEDHREISDALAKRGLPEVDHLRSFESWGSHPPRIEGCLASVACGVEQLLDGGDHEIVIGSVREVSRRPAGEHAPLVYFQGNYVRIQGE